MAERDSAAKSEGLPPEQWQGMDRDEIVEELENLADATNHCTEEDAAKAGAHMLREDAAEIEQLRTAVDKLRRGMAWCERQHMIGAAKVSTAGPYWQIRGEARHDVVSSYATGHGDTFWAALCDAADISTDDREAPC